jgi:hypothetical protein
VYVTLISVCCVFILRKSLPGYFNTLLQQYDDFTVESGHMGPKVYVIFTRY